MRRGLPWLIAAFVLVTAVAGVQAARDDGRATVVIRNIGSAQDRVVLALKPSESDRVVLPLDRSRGGRVILAVQERPDAPTTLPAADEQALFGIDAPPPSREPEPTAVAVVSPEPPIVEYKARKRAKAAPRLQRERCGRACKATQYTALSRKRAKPRKRSKHVEAAKATPEVVTPAELTATAETPKQVDLRVPAQTQRSSAALVAADAPKASSGGIRLDGRTSLTLRPLSTVMPARTPDNGDGPSGRAAFSDERDDPSRSGAAVGVTFKLN